MLAKLLDHFFPWIKRPPSLIALALACALVLVGQVLKTYGVMGPLGTFTRYMERSLASFDALNIARVYYQEVSGCNVSTWSCPPGPTTTEVLMRRQEGQPGQPGILTRAFVAVPTSLVRLFGEATGLGIVIYLMALSAAGVGVAGMASVREGGPAGWLLFLALVPALASGVALLLQWVLALLTLLLSEVLSGVATLLASFPVYIRWMGYGIAALKTGHSLDKFGEGVLVQDPPNAPPKA
jgi:hypothetical protein